MLKKERRGKVGRQTPEPELEPEGTRKSCWNKILLLKKERRGKVVRQASEPEPEPKGARKS